MSKVLALLVCVVGLTAIACQGQVQVVEVPVTVTPLPAATQELHAATADPTATPTWQEWLGQQIAWGSCPSPNGTVFYRNEHREPPYSADFYCLAPTPTLDAVATQVAATVAAIPTPTRRAWPTPKPQPPPEYLLAELNPIMATDTAVCVSSGGTNRVERLRTNPGESYPVGNWGEYNGVTWYWEHHCDIARHAAIIGNLTPEIETYGYMKVSGFKDNWESYLEARTAILWNEDGTDTAYVNCVSRDNVFVVENINDDLRTDTGWTIDWDCRSPVEDNRADPLPTPTMQQMAEWDLNTNHAWDRCRRNGGEFEIYDIRQRSDGGWSWTHRCNPPPEAERRQRTEGQSEQNLLECGFGVGLAIYTGDWLSALACLNLLVD